jgi:exosortase
MDKIQVSPQKHPHNWRLFFQCLILFVIIGTTFHQSIDPLFARWIKWDQDLVHSIPSLIGLLFLLLRIDKIPYKNDSRLKRSICIIFILLISLSWLALTLSNIKLLANFFIILGIVLLVAASYSIRTAYFFLPLLGILFFTLPIFSSINNFLILLSSQVVGFLVRIVGITAFIEGQSIFLSSGQIFIADGCSGLRYFTISLLLGYLLTLINNYNFKQTIITFLVAVTLGLAVNWIRIFVLVMIGDLTQMKSDLLHDHEFFGWVLFACFIFPAIFFAPAGARKKIDHSINPSRFRPLLPLITFLAGPILIIVIPKSTLERPTISLQSLNTTHDVTTVSREFFAKLPKGYSEEEITINKAVIKLVQYPAPSQQDKIVPYFEPFYDAKEWLLLKEKTAENLKKIGYKMLMLKQITNQQHAVLLYRFEVGNYKTAHYLSAKLLQIPAHFSRKPYSHFFGVYQYCTADTCSTELDNLSSIAHLWDEKTGTDNH